MATAGKSAALVSLERAAPHDVWSGADFGLLDEVVPPAPPFPSEVLMGWRGWAETVASNASAPVDYVGTATLSAAASAIGSTRLIAPWGADKDFRQPALLNLAHVGLPSSGKGPSFNILRAVLASLEADMTDDYERLRSGYEAAKEAAAIRHANWKHDVKGAVDAGVHPPDLPDDAREPDAPGRPRLVVTDSTVEELAMILHSNPRGVLLAPGEMAGWLGNMDRYGGNGGDRAFFLDSFDAIPNTRVDRRKNSGQPIVVPFRHISIIGEIQPDKMRSMLLSGDDDGLSARFLYVWPDRLPDFSRPACGSDVDFARHALRRLLDLKHGTDGMGRMVRVPIPMTDNAAALLESFFRDLRRREECAGGLLLSHIGKYRGIAARLALILEHLWWSLTGNPTPPQAVGKPATLAAIALLESYFLPMATRCFGASTVSPADRDAAALARYLRDRHREPTFTKRDVYSNSWGGIGDRKRATEALEKLAEANLVRFTPTRQGGGKGRQSDLYEVHPALRSD
jgi:hypothetical protein